MIPNFRDKKVIGALFAVLIVLASGVFYYNDDVNKTRAERVMRSILPGTVVALIISGAVFALSEDKSDIFLEEDFWA